MLDLETDQVLFEKNADRQIPPASMSKLMTAYMVLEQLKDGRLKMDDTLPISEKAWKKGGSKMFVEVGKRARIDDLLRGIIVLSGNDACIVVAEGLAGSEENFARDMTLKGQEIGLTSSVFKNASGWPDPEPCDDRARFRDACSPTDRGFSRILRHVRRARFRI